MLVLSRRPDESIVLALPDGQLIKVQVVEVRGQIVKLGIEAPPEMPCHREEVYKAIQREQNK